MSPASTSSEKRKQHYQKSFAKHGVSPKSLQWASYRAAARRYRTLTDSLEIEGKTVLDAGCGMGDLLPYLYARANEFNYLGVDITPEFIAIARDRYAGHIFEAADPFADNFKGAFEVVLCCGVLNDNKGDWMSRRKQMIQKLWDMTGDTLAFNMAGFHGASSTDTVTKVAYAPIDDIVAFCKTLTTHVAVKDDYHPRDFTVIMHR